MIILALFLLPGTEREWTRYLQAAHFPSARVDAVIWDRSQVDLLLKGKAVEVDWSNKWAEGTGQAIFYGRMTKREPVLLLLSRDSLSTTEMRYHMRAKIACGEEVELWIYDIKKKEFVLGPS